jgi:hypothetical protein
MSEKWRISFANTVSDKSLEATVKVKDIQYIFEQGSHSWSEKRRVLHIKKVKLSP